MPNPNYAKGGGSWSNATNCYVKHNGSWVEADEGWKNINGTWTKFYDKYHGTATLQFNATTSSINEGNSSTSTHTVAVTRSGNTANGTATVDYATANLTATAGVDYAAASGTLSFSAGETSKNISITINGDTTYEANETFKITLSNPTNNDGDAALGSNTVHTVTITNDDTTTTTTTAAPATTPVPTTTTAAPTTTTTAAPDTYYMGVTCWSDTALILKSPGSMGWGGASKTGTVVKTDGGGCYTLQGTGSTNDESWSGSGYTIVSVHADCAACLGQTTTTTEEPTTTTTTEAPENGS